MGELCGLVGTREGLTGLKLAREDEGDEKRTPLAEDAIAPPRAEKRRRAGRERKRKEYGSILL